MKAFLIAQAEFDRLSPSMISAEHRPIELYDIVIGEDDRSCRIRFRPRKWGGGLDIEYLVAKGTYTVEKRTIQPG